YAEAVRLDGDRLALELWRCMDEAKVAASGGGALPGPRPRGRASLPASPRPPAGPAPRPRTRATNGRRPSNLAPLRQPTSPWVPKPGRIKRMAPALERAAIVLLLIVLAVGIWDLQRSRPVNKPKAPAQIAGFAQPSGASAAPASAASTPPPSTLSTTPVSD